jgi:hypothetical protein
MTEIENPVEMGISKPEARHSVNLAGRPQTDRRIPVALG